MECCVVGLFEGVKQCGVLCSRTLRAGSEAVWSVVESGSTGVKQCGVLWNRTLRGSEAVWSVVESDSSRE